MPNKIKLNEKEVILLYDQYKSIRKVSKILNVSVTPILRILYKNNVVLNSSRKYDVDENFFNIIDTEDKAYWLGFLYADGCIRLRKTSSVVEFKQHKRDMDIFEKFKYSIKANYPIVPIKNSNTYQISISNKKLVSALIDKGCVPKKAHILKFPNEDILPLHLQSHFIRGIFDGDGSISLHSQTNRSDKQPVANIAGTKNIVEYIKNVLRFSRACISKVYNKSGTYTWYINIQNKIDMMLFYNYLYKDAHVFMNRKLNKFKEIISKGYMNYNYKWKHRKRDQLGRFI